MTFTNVRNSVRIGSYVWRDVDEDGVQDVGEPAIQDAIVALLMDDGNGNFVSATDINGNSVVSVTTSITGIYGFINLLEGDYRVRVTPPDGYVPSLVQTVGNNNDMETDSNIATEPTSGTFESGTFTLSVNGEPAESGAQVGDNQDDANDADGNMTVDFGFTTLSLGNLVFCDVNNNGLFDENSVDFGIANVDLTLYLDDGTTPGLLDINDTQIPHHHNR